MRAGRLGGSFGARPEYSVQAVSGNSGPGTADHRPGTITFTKSIAAAILGQINDGYNPLVARALRLYIANTSEGSLLALDAFAFLPEQRQIEINCAVSEGAAPPLPRTPFLDRQCREAEDAERERKKKEAKG